MVETAGTVSTIVCPFVVSLGSFTFRLLSIGWAIARLPLEFHLELE